jgi:hypothetical protein
MSNANPTKAEQRKQGQTAWLRELLKRNDLDGAARYAAKHGLSDCQNVAELDSQIASSLLKRQGTGGAGVALERAGGNMYPSTSPQFFYTKESPDNGLRVNLKPGEGVQIFRGEYGAVQTETPECQDVPPFDPPYTVRTEGPCNETVPQVGIPRDLEPAREKLPAGVYWAVMTAKMQNQRRYWATIKGERVQVWVTLRDRAKMIRVVGRTLPVKVNADALQGGYVLWKGGAA